ncbi:MAG: transporter substrate-binding domain-containing protein [Burkholderiales bacterium]|nr:transporter substrate-binding domain-containing protein [Burkholderiales bacterium]
MRFSTQVKAENHAFKQRQLFVSTLCNKLGWHCALESYPPQRVEALLRQGMIDVEVGRAELFANIVPEAVKVPTQLTLAHFAILALANNANANQARTWQDLRPLRVSYIRGYKFIEKHSEIAQLHPIDHYHSCIGMLLAKRSDVCLISVERIQELLQEERQQTKDFYIQPFTSEPLFLYLSKQKAHLLPEIEHVMRQMHTDGSLQKIFADPAAPLTPKR